MRRLLRLAAVAASLALPAAALADEPRLRLDIVDDDGSQVHLDVGLGWLKGAIAFADVRCRADVDEPAHAMAVSLAAQGEGGFYEFDQRDGDRVTARRARNELRLEVREHDGGRSLVEIPWPLAECWLLGREPAGGLTRALSKDGLHVRIDAHDGEDRVRLTLD